MNHEGAAKPIRVVGSARAEMSFTNVQPQRTHDNFPTSREGGRCGLCLESGNLLPADPSLCTTLLQASRESETTVIIA